MKTSRVLIGCAALVCALMTTVHAGSVWDDCAAWYIGGVDQNGNGYYDVNELVDIRHAGDPASPMHVTQLENASRQNVQILSENVDCATLGRTLPNQPVLYFDGSCSTTNGDTVTVNGNYIQLPTILTNDSYTAIIRFKMDQHHPYTTSYQYLLNLGSDYNRKRGVMLAFPNNPDDNRLHVTYGGAAVANMFDGKICLTNSLYAKRSDTWQELAFVASRSSPDKVRFRAGLFQPNPGSRANMNTDAKEHWAQKDYSLTTSPITNNFPVATSQRIGAEGTGDKTHFRGRVHMLAFWNRALSDAEIRAAFGSPNPGLLQVGLPGQEGGQLFAGTSSEDVTISATPENWRKLPARLAPNQTLNVEFNVGNWQTNVNQVFQFTPSAGTGLISLAIDGRSVKSGVVVRAGETARVFVPGQYLSGVGTHICTIQRVDAGGGNLVLGGFALGGSWQIGFPDRNFGEMNTASQTDDDFWLYSAHWMQMRRAITKTKSSIVHFDVPDLLRRYKAKLVWATTGNTASAGTANKMTVKLNDEVLADFPSAIKDSVWHTYEFPENAFVEGENTLTFSNTGDGSYYAFDFIRLEIQPIPSGTLVIVR